MSDRSYWYGEQQAVLQKGEIRAAWGSGDHSGISAEFCNRAFSLFFRARKAQRDLTDRSHAESIGTALDDCGRTGWGGGISDMEEAFDHYASNAGMWTDESVSEYFGGPRKVFPKGSVTAPVSIVNFMTAIDNKGTSVLLTTVDDYVRKVQELADSLKSIPTTTATLSEFDKSVQAIAQLKSSAERVKPWLWTSPAWESRAGRFVTVTDVLGKLQTCISTYTRYRFMGFGVTESATIAAFREAIGFVPVLGSFYQTAADLIPGIAETFAVQVDRYHATILRTMSAR